jgi:hypothetical protein
MLMKAQIEQQVKQSDPYQQNLLRMMEAFSPKAGAIDTTGTDESGNVVGIDRNDYFMKPTFGSSGPSFSLEMKPEAALRNKLKEQKATQELKSQISPKKQQDDLQKAQLAYQNLGYLRDKAKNLPTGYGAIGTNFGNFFSRGEVNPELALYEKQMPAMAVAVYRDITGDTRLSDSDAQARAYPLLWNARRGEGKSIREGVFNDLEKLYKARISLIQKGQYKSNPKDPEEMITPIEDVLNEAKIGKNVFTSSEGNTDVVAQYMKKYPNRSKAEIIKAMQKQGM